VHHILFWTDGGITEPNNLVSLCAFHHQRLHERAFRIVVDAAGVVTFRSAQGVAIQQVARPLKADGFDGARWLHQLSMLAGREIDAATRASPRIATAGPLPCSDCRRD
jgi:hypothetical protein